MNIEGVQTYCMSDHLNITSDRGFLLMIESLEKADILSWVKKHVDDLHEVLLEYGGVLLRNFNLSSLSEFYRFAEYVFPNLLDYVYRSSPRTCLGKKVYTTTEYPAHLSIPLHNENSYSDQWPGYLLFYSMIPALEGGQTPIANSRAVYNALDESVRTAFEKHGVIYERAYSPGFDLSWQEVFQTEVREDVEQYCDAHGIAFQWCDGAPELRTKQICQASIMHPKTKERVWFNQAHLFHPSSLERSDYQQLVEALGKDALPRNAFYGNGEEIPSDVLDHIRDTYRAHTVIFDWKRNDIMLLDNLLLAHGRAPFKGERKVAIAMANG